MMKMIKGDKVMKICKCDRCGKIFEPTEHNGKFYNSVIQVGDETFDLLEPECEIDECYDICEDCYKDFQRWMKRGRIRNG